MTGFLNWVKKNKFVLFLLAVFLVYSWWRDNSIGGINNFSSRNSYSDVVGNSMLGVSSPLSFSTANYESKRTTSMAEVAPPTDTSSRMTVQNGSISLLVKDVNNTQKQISEKVKSIGGYVVNSDVTRPTEQPYGNMTIRVPSEKLEEVFGFLRGLGMKITSESISGYDVTDQYEDLETRLTYLQRSLAQIQAIQDQAKTYDEILSGTREVISLQQQIDSLKGRQLYLEQTAKLALVNITMSTDELALPYAPDANFRPNVIFKLAVRSLMSTLQNLGKLAIWVAVYSVIWAPVVIIWLIVKRNRKSQNKSDGSIKKNSTERMMAEN